MISEYVKVKPIILQYSSHVFNNLSNWAYIFVSWWLVLVLPFVQQTFCSQVQILHSNNTQLKVKYHISYEHRVSHNSRASRPVSKSTTWRSYELKSEHFNDQGGQFKIFRSVESIKQVLLVEFHIYSTVFMAEWDKRLTHTSKTKACWGKKERGTVSELGSLVAQWTQIKAVSSMHIRNSLT